jgi:hypothetical protein
MIDHPCCVLNSQEYRNTLPSFTLFFLKSLTLHSTGHLGAHGTFALSPRTGQPTRNVLNHMLFPGDLLYLTTKKSGAKLARRFVYCSCVCPVWYCFV